MDCRNVRDLADSYLSEQLLVETNHELLRHLESCPSCRAEIEARRVLRGRLRSAFAQAEDLRPRGDFADDLARHLRPTPAVVSRRTMLRSWWAVAAGLALTTGGALFVRQSRARSALAELARVAAGDHRNCAVRFSLAERPIPLDEAGRRFGSPYADMAGFSLPSLDRPVRSIDRHSCVYGGQRFAHLVFTYDARLTSLLVTAEGAPSGVRLEQETDGLHTVSLPAGRFLGFLVAETDAATLLSLARTLSSSLSASLT